MRDSSIGLDGWRNPAVQELTVDNHVVRLSESIDLDKLMLKFELKLLKAENASLREQVDHWRSLHTEVVRQPINTYDYHMAARKEYRMDDRT